MRELGPDSVGNAEEVLGSSSLAREGDSKPDQRKHEELERPRRFQEDEELYAEKERNQKMPRRFMEIIPLMDAPTVRLQLQRFMLRKVLLDARLSAR